VAGSDLYVGTLELLILKALTERELHGYGIGRWIRESTGEVLQVHEGVLYPALHRLEQKGMLSEQWGMTDTNREAKFYRLTAVGRKHLRRELERWARHTGAVNKALSLSEG
jgi:PadR family transcriptional regulator